MLMASRLKQQSGMGMIEALIALLVISIGLLGIAALQLTSLRQSSSANWHSQAVWYSYEMTDRINANRAAFGAYNNLDTANNPSQDCQLGECNPAEMVTADLEEWKVLVENLPGGRGFVKQNAGLVTVSVMWDDGADATNCANAEAGSTGMTCFTVTMQ